MRPDQFDHIVRKLDSTCHAIIKSKRPEYTDGKPDVLENFKRAAERTNTSPLQVAFIFLDKHIASIGQHCAGKSASSEPILNRLADARNYIDIIWALTNEMRNFPIPGKDQKNQISKD